MNPDVKAAIIGQLAMFRGGWHELPYDHPLMTQLQSEGLVLLVQPVADEYPVTEPYWAPTRKGLELRS